MEQASISEALVAFDIYYKRRTHMQGLTVAAGMLRCSVAIAAYVLERETTPCSVHCVRTIGDHRLMTEQAIVVVR